MVELHQSMSTRKELLEQHGFTVDVHRQSAFRGHPTIHEIHYAERGGWQYVVAKDEAHFGTIQKVLKSVPYASKIVERFDGIAVFERAKGEILWHLETLPDLQIVERSLREFVDALRPFGVAHADIRPWNVMWDDIDGVRVIDWGFPFIHGETRWGDHIVKHLNSCAGELMVRDVLEVDIIDIRKLMQLLRGEIGLKAAWNYGSGAFSWRPHWCNL
ncbi:MAG TPA: phosphotransferase [Tepidisphaeraceae bacterium]|nr:phosphotransferase [Tepidisphaeraceae bacterium]